MKKCDLAVYGVELDYDIEDCPACGGHAAIIRDIGYYMCSCLQCDCRTLYRPTEVEAIEDWNEGKVVHRWSF